MATRTNTPPPEDDLGRVVDIDVEDEMRSAFLEYAYCVIYSRALPDARDGLKPVQRRILYTMAEHGLRPDRGHVKSRPGRRRGHGPAAPARRRAPSTTPWSGSPSRWSMRLPLVDGHGNFGSLDDGPAAMRYTEAGWRPRPLRMTDDLDEDTVDFMPNYDERETRAGGAARRRSRTCSSTAPPASPSAWRPTWPRTTSSRSFGAARHLIDHPDCSLDDLMRFVPGPDLPTGGKIVGLDGVRDAYDTGRGTLPDARHRAGRERSPPRRMGIVVTELPYRVGPEKVIERIKTLVQAKKLQGISDVKDLTDREHGLRLVIEIKNGFNPEAVLEQLYKHTPMEDSFGINTVALVDGQPRTLGLKELLEVYLGTASTSSAGAPSSGAPRRADRLHLVDGLLVAILDIDEVIQLIRSSDDAAEAKERLISVFDLSRGPGRLHPRHAAAPPHEVLPDRARDRARRAAAPIEDLEAILADEKLLPPDRLRRARRRREGPRHAAAHRPARVGGHPGDPATPLEVPTTRAACCSPPPACWRGPPTPSPSRPTARGPATTWWSAPSAPPPAARSGWSPPSAG